MSCCASSFDIPIFGRVWTCQRPEIGTAEKIKPYENVRRLCVMLLLFALRVSPTQTRPLAYSVKLHLMDILLLFPESVKRRRCCIMLSVCVLAASVVCKINHGPWVGAPQQKCVNSPCQRIHLMKQADRRLLYQSRAQAWPDRHDRHV